MKIPVLLMSLLLPCFLLYAQWQPTNGPYSGFTKELKFNSQYAYASFSNGLYRTGDGGQSWQKLTTGLVEHYDAVHFNVSGESLLLYIKAYTATRLSGLYRSGDNGDNWFRVNEPGLPTSAIRKLMVYEDKLFLQVSSNEAIFSTDNGLSWLPVELEEPDNQRFNSDFMVFDDNLYIGGQGRINKLAAGNNNWEIIALPVSQMPVRDLFIYGDTIMAGNPAITFRSEDGGQSWEQTDEYAFGIVLLDGVLYRRGFPLHRSMDFGKTWEYIPTNYDESFDNYIGSTGLAANHNNLLVGDYARGIYASTDLGFNWHRASAGIGNSGVNAVAIADDAIYVANYFAGSIDRYDFGTGSWNKEPLMEWLYQMTDVAKMGGTIFAIGGESHNAWRSFNSGQSWDTISFGYNFYEHCLQGENLLFVWGEYNYYGQPIITENLGESWQDFTAEIYNQVGFDAFAFRAGDGILYAYSSFAIAISRDGGHNWEAVERGEEPSFLGHLIAGGNILLKDWPLLPGSPEVSWDYGATFHPTTGLPTLFGDNLGPPVQRLALVEGNYILATSSGLYVSQDGGLNWASLPHNIPTNSMQTVCYYRDTIYLGSRFHGLWKAPFASLPLTPVSGAVNGLNLGGNSNSFQVISNPSSGAFIIKLNHAEAFQGQLLIYNGVGQLLFNRCVQFNRLLSLPESGLPHGYYLAVLQNEVGRYSSPLIIQR